jgi:hypothetical protein
VTLRRKGAVPVPWFTPDFPMRTGETLAFEGGRLAIEGPAVDPGGGRIDTVWNRRPSHAVDLAVLHAADRPFAERSCETLRRSYAELRMEPCEVEADLGERCVALLARLGFVFGCFDFVVTPEGRAVFLEVNQMGQFLFVEENTGLPLLDAFAEMLVQGRPDFA